MLHNTESLESLTLLISYRTLSQIEYGLEELTLLYFWTNLEVTCRVSPSNPIYSSLLTLDVEAKDHIPWQPTSFCGHFDCVHIKNAGEKCL